MNKLLTFLASILIAVTGCASPPAVNDVKISQAVKVSPPTWVDRTFSPVANSLFGFDSSVLPVNVTVGSGLTLDATTHVLSANSNSVNANSLTGTTLASNVVNSSLTSVGTLADLTVTNPINGNITGNAGSATSASNTTNAFITDDTTTNASYQLVWVTGSPTGGNKPLHVSSSKFIVNPSTGRITATSYSGTLVGNVTGGTITGTIRPTSAPPANASDTGTAGTITWDSSFFYVCIATNTWVRTPLSTW